VKRPRCTLRTANSVVTPTTQPRHRRQSRKCLSKPPINWTNCVNVYLCREHRRKPLPLHIHSGLLPHRGLVLGPTDRPPHGRTRLRRQSSSDRPASSDYLAQHGRLVAQTSSSFPTHSTTCTSCQHVFVLLPAHDTFSCMRAQSSTRVIQKSSRFGALQTKLVFRVVFFLVSRQSNSLYSVPLQLPRGLVRSGTALPP
jgi:hypothetical protein